MQELDLAEFYEISGTPRSAETGAVALHYWASIDQVDNLRQVQNDSGKQALLITDFFGNTPLHYAAICSAYNAAAMMVEYFPSEEFYNIDKITPAHIAAQHGDNKMLEILAKTEKLMYETSKDGWTPLHFAIFYQRIPTVRWILENCDAKLLRMMTISATSVLDSIPSLALNFLSPLDLAKQVNNDEIIGLLNAHNALPSLYCAILNRDFRAISYHLFSNRASIEKLNMQAEYRNSTPLHWAVASKQYDICHSLVENGARPDILDCDGLSALDIAVAINSLDYAKIMAGRCTPQQLSKAIFLAADLNRAQIGLILLKSNFDSTMIDEQSGDSLMIRLIKRRLMGHAEMLMEKYQQNLMLCDKRGATALHYAAATPRATKIVKLLMNKGLSGDLRDGNGTTALCYYIRAHLKESETNRKSMKITPPPLDLLGSNPNLEDNFGMTPSTYAILSNFVDKFEIGQEAAAMKYNLAIKKLIEPEEEVVLETSIWNYTEYKAEKLKVSHFSLYNDECIKNMESVWVKTFLDKSPDGMLSGATVAHIAVLLGSDTMTLKRILDKYPELTDARDGEERTPLHIALLIRRCEMAEFLISRSANIMAVDADGNSVWHYADDVSTLNILNTAVMHHGDRNIDIANNKGDTPIHFACKKGLYNVLKTLTTFTGHAALSAKNHAGEVPLDYALMSRSDECISFLHAHGVENRLISAAAQGDISLVEALLTKGYPINSCDHAGNTALHIAASNKNGAEMARYLISKKCDTNSISTAGLSPLHIAAKECHSEIIKILLSTNMNLTKFPLENQPFMMCPKDSPDREFLFQYWKRQVVTMKLFELMRISDEALIIAGTEIEFLIAKYEKKSTLPMHTKAIISHMIFVSDKITMRGSDQGGNAFNFMTSLHHLLSITTTIDFSEYFDVYKRKIKDFVEIGKQKFGLKGVISALYFVTFPLYWMTYIADIIHRLEQYMIKEIDNLEACRNISRKLTEAANVIKSDLIDREEFKHQLSQLLGDEVIRNHRGLLSPVLTARIEDIVKHSKWSWQTQVVKGLRDFFGPEFSLPRSITWKNKSSMDVVIVGESLIIGRKDATISIPLFFLHTTFVSNPDGYTITSPIGSFRLTFGNYYNMTIPFKLHLLYVQTMMNPFDEGASYVQKQKSKIFQTLASYELSGSREVHMKLMMVKADKESECRDICYSHVTESLAAPPTFFNSISRECNNVIFC